MTKYLSLKQHLMGISDVNEWKAAFSDIEELLGFSLPTSAYKYPAWWSNQTGAHIQAQAWMDAGWRTSRLNLKGRHVTFVRAARTSRPAVERNVAARTPGDEKVADTKTGLTIDEAKAGLAVTFGVPHESIEITIRM